MHVHDPELFIHLFRDHLAAHDKRLVFLFGAGTSSAINIAPPARPGSKQTHEPLIPAIERMTSLCATAVKGMSAEHAAAWSLLETECLALSKQPHIENILGRLRLKLDAAGPTDTTLGLDLGQLADLEERIRDTIAELASPSETSIPAHLPHDRFSQWIRQADRRYPVEVFTTNYDILIERSLEKARVSLFDGFVGSYQPFFSPEAIENDATIPGRRWTRVWKLHGSANWKLIDHVPVRQSTTGASDMILPSHRKYDESRKMPYLALMDRFARCLSEEGALLVTCGYSWSDEHVNATILTALDHHPNNAVIALLYSDPADLANVIPFATTRHNLFAIGSRRAVIRGQVGNWVLPHAITRATASFLDISFDSDAIVGKDDEPVPGRMRLGDFEIFCRFLAAMRPGVSE